MVLDGSRGMNAFRKKRNRTLKNPKPKRLLEASWAVMCTGTLTLSHPRTEAHRYVYRSYAAQFRTHFPTILNPKPLNRCLNP